MVGSLDVELLYPLIDQREGPRLVAEENMKSNREGPIQIFMPKEIMIYLVH